jgi:hypothetical protein
MSEVKVIQFLRPNVRPNEVERIERMAPPAPPCFASHAEWQEYLAWCLASAEPGMLPTRSSTEAEPDEAGRLHRRRLFNEGLSFCKDCEPDYRARMEKAVRCRPYWLVAREWDTSKHPLLTEELACA